MSTQKVIAIKAALALLLAVASYALATAVRIDNGNPVGFVDVWFAIASIATGFMCLAAALVTFCEAADELL